MNTLDDLIAPPLTSAYVRQFRSIAIHAPPGLVGVVLHVNPGDGLVRLVAEDDTPAALELFAAMLAAGELTADPTPTHGAYWLDVVEPCR